MIFLTSYIAFYLSSRIGYWLVHPPSREKLIMLVPGTIEVMMLYYIALEVKYQFDIMYELAKILIKGY